MNTQNIWGHYTASEDSYKFLNCGQYPEKNPDYYFFLFESDLRSNNIHNIRIPSSEAEDIADAFPKAKKKVKDLIARRKQSYYTTTITYPDFRKASDLNYTIYDGTDFIYTDTADNTKMGWDQLDAASTGTITDSGSITYNTTSITDYVTNDQQSYFYAPPTGVNISSKDGAQTVELQHGSVYINGKKEDDA